MATEYIGSLISLISKSDIRYQGILHSIDPVEATVSLEKVRSLGTEGRKSNPAEEIAPNDNVYEFIVFRAADVKDLQIIENPTPAAAPVIDDPAIVTAAPPVSQVPPQQQQQQQQRQRYPQQQQGFNGYQYPPGPPPQGMYMNGAPPPFPPYGYGPPPPQFGAPGQFNNGYGPPPPRMGGYPGQPPMQQQFGAPPPQNQQPQPQQMLSPALSNPAEPSPKTSAANVTTQKDAEDNEVQTPATRPAPAQAKSSQAPPQKASTPTAPRAMVPAAVVVPIPQPAAAAPAKPRSYANPGPPIAATPAPAPTNNGDGRAKGPAGGEIKVQDVEKLVKDMSLQQARGGFVQNSNGPRGGYQTNGPPRRNEGGVGGSVFGNATTNGGGERRGGGVGAISGGGRQLQPFGRPAPVTVPVPATDFDFQQSNAKFSKDTIVDTTATTSIDDDDDAVVIPPAAAEFYDKKSSFFDSISSETRQKFDRSAESNKNLDTFGESGQGYGNGIRRGRGGGRGRGGRGRGSFQFQTPRAT